MAVFGPYYPGQGVVIGMTSFLLMLLVVWMVNTRER